MFNYRKSFQIIVLEEVEKNVSIKELDRDQGRRKRGGGLGGL